MKRTMILVGVVGCLLYSNAQAEVPVSDSCRAFFTWENDVYSMTPSGSDVLRYTEDHSTKLVIRPDTSSSRIAFITLERPTQLSISDSSGRVASYSSNLASSDDDAVSRLYADGAVEDLRWISDRVLGVEKHVSPSTSYFEMVRLPQGLDGSLQRVGAPVFGSTCAFSPSSEAAACVDGDTVVMGAEVVYQHDDTVGADHVGAVELALGQSESMPGLQGARIELLGVEQGNVDLRVTLDDGRTIRHVLRPQRRYFTLQTPDRPLLAVASIDESQSSVHVVIMRTASEHDVFSQALAWRPDGQALALIDETGDDRRLVVISKLGDESWHSARSRPLAMGGDVRSLMFVGNDSLLAGIGASDYALLSVADDVTDATSLTVSSSPMPSSIPVTLNGSSVDAKINTWSCRAVGG